MQLLPVCEASTSQREECVALLNDQWPRSTHARRLYLERSAKTSYELPQSMLLLEDGGRLVAHARLCTVPNRPDACWIDSVVVRRDLRGRGIGRQLMVLCEERLQEMHITTVYLSTHDQQRFYTHCGYKPCAPIVIAGGVTQTISQLCERLHSSNSYLEEEQVIRTGNVDVPVPEAGSVPAPPPPPTTLNKQSQGQPQVQFMTKSLPSRP